MKTRIQQILTELECVQESFLGLSDDIWLNIEHNDSQAVQKGSEFKVAFNKKLHEFNRISSEISDLIENYTNIHPESIDIVQKSSLEHERIIRELDSSEPHSIEETFTFKRPYGFVFEGQAYKDVKNWQRLYRLFCKQLAKKNIQLFKEFINSTDAKTVRGNVFFASEKKVLRKALEIDSAIYAEGNLSANDIRDRIKSLLNAFKIEPKELSIYLREDRNAME
ncbi:hypothetical protein H6G96_29060 [Nostoc sp. FACHB-892]|uniref:hypothetical protein n=1 Tax=Nostoc sp. FACHB-892 TaxID=2692843 RepID=UPI0016838BD4|nr:hypothetical protein [Nostoc sp. FACHB-892]MBD2730256.1 hypothetical protein [Nostoc sp. FACHB-892]